MLCVSFGRCGSGNPPTCFGVFIQIYSSEVFVRRVFWDELLRRSGAGVVMVFCKENALFLLEKPRGKKFSFA